MECNGYFPLISMAGPSTQAEQGLKMTEDAVSNDLMPSNKKQQVGGGERAVFYTIILLNVRGNERPAHYGKQL